MIDPKDKEKEKSKDKDKSKAQQYICEERGTGAGFVEIHKFVKR